MPPTVPINHYYGPKPIKWTLVLFHYSMLVYSCKRLPETLWFFQSKVHDPPTDQWRPRKVLMWMATNASETDTFITRNSTTSFLTATTLIYAIGAGITAAAGTRLALQLFLVKWFKLFSLQSRKPWGPELLFLVTTSLNQDWVIYAPAAFRRCGSRFSGSLSGIEP